MGRSAELDYDPFLTQFLSRGYAWNAPIPKLLQRPIMILDIRGVEVARESRVAVNNHSLGAIDPPLDLVLFELAKKFEQIGGKRLLTYFDSLRYEALASGELEAKTRLCKKLEAWMRFVRVISRYWRLVHSSASPNDFDLRTSRAIN